MKTEVVITGCNDCPCLQNSNIGFYCGIDWDVEGINCGFPENCPLRDPNFKFIRVFKDK